MQAFLAWPDSLDLAKLCSLESLAKLQFYWYSVCCLAKRWGSVASYMAPFSFSVHAQGHFCLTFMNFCSWLSVNIVSAHVHTVHDSTICRKSLRGRLPGMDHCWWVRLLGMDHCWWIRPLGMDNCLWIRLLGIDHCWWIAGLACIKPWVRWLLWAWEVEVGGSGIQVIFSYIEYLRSA